MTLRNPSRAVAENLDPPSVVVSHQVRIAQTTAIFGSRTETILELRPLPPSSASTPRPQPVPLPSNENQISQQFASVIPVSGAESAPLFPLATHLNGAGASLPENTAPVRLPVNTVDSIPTLAGVSRSESYKAEATRPGIANLGRRLTASAPSRARFGFHRRSDTSPTPVRTSDSPSSRAPVTAGTSAALPEVTAPPDDSAVRVPLTPSQDKPPTSEPPHRSGIQGGKEPPSSSAPKDQRPRLMPVVTTPAPTTSEAESYSPKLVTSALPAAESPQGRKRRLPGAIDPAPGEENTSWRGWMKKKVMRKAVRYVWGVPLYD
ncbi:hypothetical protein FRB95_011571 [Tulasnella sp. JGI-2019a]|nr:hypothetical protein FRB95_011571 [Tulasnella sp. JGI-2019a]